MNKKEQLESELASLHGDISALSDIWEQSIAEGMNSEGDILVDADTAIKISVLLGF